LGRGDCQRCGVDGRLDLSANEKHRRRDSGSGWQWRNDGAAAASSDGGPTGRGGDKERKGQRGPRPEKVTWAPDGCVTPLLASRISSIR